jgi:hypothetical protein
VYICWDEGLAESTALSKRDTDDLETIPREEGDQVTRRIGPYRITMKALEKDRTRRIFADI